MVVLYSVLGAILALLLVLILVLVIRAAMFKPKENDMATLELVHVDKQKAVDTLQAIIKCKTISSHDKSLEDEKEFSKFENLLPTLFPTVFSKCAFQKLGPRSLLFKMSGSDAEGKEAVVLMAHYDVVSVEEQNWKKPAFDGIIEDGILWGRGTIDTKNTLNGVLNAAEALLASGFTPERDVYMAFAGDEEIMGTGATTIIEYLQKNNVKVGLVIDEGGAVVEGVFPGVKSPCALVGIAEKGMADMEFGFKGNGGHASSPLPHTPIGILSKACVDVENHPFKGRLSEPARQMFDTLGRHSSFALKLIFANLWLTKPLLDKICKKQGGELNALMRTTCAYTQMQGSKGSNVIPPEAKMVANLRLIDGDTVDSAVEYLKKTINNDKITVKPLRGFNPSRISRTDCDEWQLVKRCIASTWTGCIVSPYLMVACSDSRHYGAVSDKVYRFSAMALSTEERGMIHGNNERIPLDTIAKTVEFYTRVIKSL